MIATVNAREPFPPIVQRPSSSCSDMAWKVAKCALQILTPCTPALVFFFPISFTAAVCITAAGVVIMAIFSAVIYFEDTLELRANSEAQTDSPPPSATSGVQTDSLPPSLTPSAPSAIMPGFSNGSGSDCWLNSILQMMFSDSEIVGWIENDSMIENLVDQTQKEKYKTLKDLYLQWKSQIGQPRSAISGSKELRKFLPSNLWNGQKDAGEGLLALFDQLPASLRIQTQRSQHYDIQEKRPILDAKNGSIASSPEEAIGIVPLNISSDAPSGIALDVLCKDNFDQASSCEDKIWKICDRGWKIEYQVLRETIEILQAPSMLRFCLNRFNTRNSRTRGIVGVKNSLPVSVPLDMKLPLSDGTEAKYRLKSFNVHFGSLSGGHYVAYVRRGEQWYLANDSAVSSVTAAELDEMRNSGGPYLIFYEKVDAPAPLNLSQ